MGNAIASHSLHESIGGHSPIGRPIAKDSSNRSSRFFTLKEIRIDFSDKNCGSYQLVEKEL